MSAKKQTVIINGKTYDVATGQPVAHTAVASVKKQQMIADIAPAKTVSAPKTQSQPHKSRTVAPHTRPNLQRSTTLKRAALKKPASRVKPSAHRVHRRVQKSERITKFATPKAQHIIKKPIDKDLLAQTRALEKANAEYHAKVTKKTLPINSRLIKEHLLSKAVEQVPAHSINSHQKSHNGHHRVHRTRFTSVMMTSLALVVLGGYLTYLNIPNLSIRIAAASTGIDASLPSYQPMGYQIHGPIKYQDDEVNISYKQPGSGAGYKISQRPTDWDSTATLDNYVEDDSRNDYQTHSVQGLTVYTYDKKAVWVNGGILHVLDGSAPLSNQQVQRIVASM